MKRLALATAASLALGLAPALADDTGMTAIEWELLAIDGTFTDMPATLRFDESGRITGRAPCNRWFASNTAALPAIQLSPIGSTKRACDRLADEHIYLRALAGMQTAALDGDNLILTGADGHSMEFVREVMNSLTRCKTCAP